ncbi:MAG: hypothetical protein H6822_28665 [Planctomycetaceae bacterium]|nr:hypothetical protein [Planctomycetaceae bacterium]
MLRRFFTKCGILAKWESSFLGDTGTCGSLNVTSFATQNGGDVDVSAEVIRIRRIGKLLSLQCIDPDQSSLTQAPGVFDRLESITMISDDGEASLLQIGRRLPACDLVTRPNANGIRYLCFYGHQQPYQR